MTTMIEKLQTVQKLVERLAGVLNIILEELTEETLKTQPYSVITARTVGGGAAWEVIRVGGTRMSVHVTKESADAYCDRLNRNMTTAPETLPPPVPSYPTRPLLMLPYYTNGPHHANGQAWWKVIRRADELTITHTGIESDAHEMCARLNGMLHD